MHRAGKVKGRRLTPDSSSRLTRRAAYLLDGSFYLLVLLFCIYLFWGVPRVPFHPDESTYLFMSADWEKLFKDPLSLAWTPGQEGQPAMRYRLIDAPLTRYLIGAGRDIVGLPALPTDWDWAANWEENQANGAFPDEDLLFTGRLAISLLLPFSLILIYHSGKRMGGRLTGCLVAFLLGSNALILLHDRRAMAEGVLTFGVCLALWGVLCGDARPWLAGLGVGIAFNAKFSALALLPVGLAAVAWLPGKVPRRGWRILSGLAQLSIIFILITSVLNPVGWRQPIQALRASWTARQDLLRRQLNDTQQLAPHQALLTVGQRGIALLGNLFLTPPAFYEVGNYRQQTADSEKVYLSIPGHNLFRDTFLGGIWFLLTLIGLVLSLRRLRKMHPAKQRTILLVWLATLCQVAFLLVTIPLPWQRYVIGLVPFSCLWIAYAMGEIVQAIISSLKKQGITRTTA